MCPSGRWRLRLQARTKGVIPCGSDPLAQPPGSPFQPDLAGDILTAALFWTV